MDRRNLLMLALAASATPAGVLAQPAAGGDSPEARHAMRTLEAGAVALETSRLGMEKASEAELKRFAGLEVAEQETVAAVVKTVAKIEAPPALAGEGKQLLDKLAGLSGAEFDKAYRQGQVEGHRRLLAIQEDYLASGKDATHRAIAMLARSHIKEHLDDLAMIERIMAG